MNRTLLAIFVAAASTTAHAQNNANQTADIEETLVFGRNETQQVNQIGTTELAEYPAGTSPLKAVEKLPGVNFQSADPYGAYEWSTRIVVRGFNQNQMGFTLDEVPLGDMSYANHNGLHISRAITTENIASAALSQGAGSLAAASSSNLGGTLEFTSLDPAQEFAADVHASLGTDSAQRALLRVQSGELGEAGTRLLVSYVDQTTDKWKGQGEQTQNALNLKVVQPVYDGKLTGFFSRSDRSEIDYQDMSLEMIDRLGRDWDNYAPDYARAIDAAFGNLSGKVESQDDAYWDAAGLRKDDLAYIALELPIQSSELKATLYQHTNEGQGQWGTPYLKTPGGAPLSMRTTEYDIDRRGLVMKHSVDLEAHKVSLGLWIEQNDFNQARRFYGEASLEQPTLIYGEFVTNPFLTQWEYAFTTDTLQLHLQDSWQVTDALRINLGAKTLNVDVAASTLAGANKTGNIETSETFLPQVGFLYELSSSQQLFSTLGKNARALIGSATGTSPFSATQAGFEAIRDTIQPETATSLEFGWRFFSDALEGVVTAYRVQFDDRLLAIQQGSSIIGNFNALANVGTVAATGLEGGLNWQITDGWYWYNSASFNDSSYEDNYKVTQDNGGTSLVVLKGKTVVDSPEFMLNTEIGFDRDDFFAKLHAKHTGKRYYTYSNDKSVDAYTVMNLSLGYTLPNLGVLESLTAQLDITNLSDEDYISTIGSGGFGYSDPEGRMQTLLPGAPQQVFLSLKALF
jgi:iron complex outermembrane recepter protein